MRHVSSMIALWVVAGTLALIALIRRQSMRGAILYVAKRFGGITSSNTVWLWSYPRAIFRYHNETVTVSATRFRPFVSGPCIQLQGPWPDPYLELLIADRPRGWSRRVRRLQPWQLNTHVTPLLAWTNHPAKAQELLTASVVWQLEQLRQRARQGRLSLHIHRQWMQLRLGGHVLAEEKLYGLVVTCLQLFDQLRLSQQRELEFVAADEAQVVEEFHCPVCSSRSSAHIVLCQRCKTPHCQECWQFNGKCATYGCGETRCVTF